MPTPPTTSNRTQTLPGPIKAKIRETGFRSKPNTTDLGDIPRLLGVVVPASIALHL
jgi:hypothetical protein